MIISVTVEDIKRGVIRSASYCPVSMAIRRAMLASDVRVGSKSCVVDGVLFLMDPEIRERIWRYDHGSGMEPFDFQLKPIEMPN
jgi:hypothetical protein